MSIWLSIRNGIKAAIGTGWFIYRSCRALNLPAGGSADLNFEYKIHVDNLK